MEDYVLLRIKAAKSSVDKLTSNTVDHLYDGHAQVAASVYLGTLSRIREDLEPILGWQEIRDTNLLPAKMARRLRAFKATLDAITPDAEDLTKKIKLISDATEAAESLPTDLEELKEARAKVEKHRDEAALAQQKIDELFKKAEAATEHIGSIEKQSSDVLGRCEDAYRVATSQGLAAAFDKRAQDLSKSMWIWVVGLLAALGIGYWLGGGHVQKIADAVNSSAQQKDPIWHHLILALVSLGGPIWFAWMATKQIGQRFRLAEDYAFKASVAKAYEGYRKEAARIDEAFEARLFASALTRLEEAPLRLVEAKTPGSPWHEFVESDAFRSLLDKLPELKDAYAKWREKPSRNGKADKGDKVSLDPARDVAKPQNQ